MSRHRDGLVYGFCAYALWGLLTIYWKELVGLDAFALIGQRILWSALVLGIVLLVAGGVPALATLVRHPALLARTAVAAVLLTANWTAYVWCVTHGNVVETALGYFMAPLGLMAFGLVVLHERIGRTQAVALVLAMGAVVTLTAAYGRVPWLALLIAVTWSAYGLLKKLTTTPPVTGLAAEVLVLVPVALVVTAVSETGVHGVLDRVSTLQAVLVPLTGVATVVPLLLFGAAAHRVPLTSLGWLQYAVPVVNFALGLALYDEAMPPERLAGFVLVWAALGVLVIDGVRRAHRGRRSEPVTLPAVPLEG